MTWHRTGMQITRREMTVLSVLLDGSVRSRASVYGVGRQTFTDVIAKGWVVEPNPEHVSLQITDSGKTAFEAGGAKGIMLIEQPSGRIWLEQSHDGVSVWSIGGQIRGGFGTLEEASAYADTLRRNS